MEGRWEGRRGGEGRKGRRIDERPTDAHQQEEDEEDVEHGQHRQGQRRDDLFERPAAAGMAENIDTPYILDTFIVREGGRGREPQGGRERE